MNDAPDQAMRTAWSDPDVTSAKGAGDENFPVGSALIAAHLRAHVHRYYDFARTIDDIADTTALSAGAKVARLNAMRLIVRGEAPAPAGRRDAGRAAALAHSLDETGVAVEHATDLIVAFVRDATTPRTKDMAALLDYCRYSAAPVGRYLLDLHGESRATWPASDALCAVLQILNHLQDLKGDWRDLGRCYLPDDLMAEYGVRPEHVLEEVASPELRRVMDRLLDECDRLEASAAALPGLIRDRRLRLEAATILALARRLSARLRAGDPIAGRIAPGKTDFAASALRALRALPGPAVVAPDPALHASAADHAEIAAIVRASGTSFARGMALLPRARREAMFAIYAFCRIVDDIADEPAPLGDRRERLDIWRRRVGALYRGAEPASALERALLDAITGYDLREADFIAVIDGMAMDADTAIVAPDARELDLYCDRVAAAVGRLSVRAFGDGSAAADRVAHHLGRALQYTNILRDLGEDAARGRLYLPAEWLDAEGVPHDPEAAMAHPGLARVCRRLAAEARGQFRAASRAMAACDRHAMRPARLMASGYLAILDAMAVRGWEHPGRPVKVAAHRKLALGLGALVRARLP